MAGIGEIQPTGPLWPSAPTHKIGPTDNNKRPPQRQPRQDESGQTPREDKDDDQPHIDEYA